MTFHTSCAEETQELGKRLGSFLKKGDVIALQGPLAAGKTTLTKGIALSLNVKDTITSPTFCLISEYEGKLPLYHFDVYRLQGADDFANLGAEDMIYGDGVCLIEWSEKIMDELPQKTIIIRLNVSPSDPNARDIQIENWPYENFGEAK
ncbi:MAG: tRNA (adenosine(37)-N6)-threonylcarbamoyltransferase complex ATPase subunit type 1 TsaE [Treponema sp.]|nr:tRNA (adenosine(37)-N6)-threonylcarbamoyltransferase complex ATPase subunit type 1 TsaE [Treponema sp.]